MQIRSQLTSSFRPFFPSMINQYGPLFFTAAATTAASTLCAKLLRTLLYFFLRHANFNERGDNNNKIWYNNRWMGLFWCRVMESGCDECSLSGVLQEEGDMKDVYASFSPAQPSDAVVPHVIIPTLSSPGPFCSAHNTTLHTEGRKKKKNFETSPSLGPLFICTPLPQSIASLMHLSSPIERPTAPLCLSTRFYNSHQQQRNTKITGKIFRAFKNNNNFTPM